MNAPWRVAVTALCLTATFLAAGCVTKRKAEESKAEPNEAGHFKRGKEIRQVENDLRQIGLFYQEYSTETGHPPRNLQEFITYIQRDAPGKMIKDLQEGRYVVLWEVSFGSSKVLAYEKAADINNKHVVVMSDNSVKTMTPQELQTALPAGR